MTSYQQAALDYLAVRRALGFKLHGHDRLLVDFLDHLHDSGATTITCAAALAWATGRTNASPTPWAHRLSVLRGFAGHLHCLDPAVEVPPADLLSRPRYHPAAHLYSEADITRLLEAASTLRPALRGATYQPLLGLLSVTGMRIGEAIGLDRENVDLKAGVLHIPLTKFRKHRRLPLHESTCAALRAYAQVRDELCPHPKSAQLLRLPSRDEAARRHRAPRVPQAPRRGRTRTPIGRDRTESPRPATHLRGRHRP